MTGRIAAVAALLLLLLGLPVPALAQIKAQARSATTPPWDKGILPISPESYYHAIECGKQGGQDPPCVFWDTGLCKNGDFALARYTFDYAAFAATAGITLDLVGQTRTISCVIEQSVLMQFR